MDSPIGNWVADATVVLASILVNDVIS